MKTTANALVSVFRFPRRPAAHSLPRPAVHRPNAPKGGAVPVFLALLLASAANVPAATTYPVNTPAGTWGATGTVVSTAGDTVVLTANQSSNATLTLTANVTAGHLDIGRADAAGPATNYTFALGAYSLAFDSGNGSPSVITHEANALADSIRGTGAAASALLFDANALLVRALSASALTFNAVRFSGNSALSFTGNGTGGAVALNNINTGNGVANAFYIGPWASYSALIPSGSSHAASLSLDNGVVVTLDGATSGDYIVNSSRVENYGDITLANGAILKAGRSGDGGTDTKPAFANWETGKILITSGANLVLAAPGPGTGIYHSGQLYNAGNITLSGADSSLWISQTGVNKTAFVVAATGVINVLDGATFFAYRGGGYMDYQYSDTIYGLVYVDNSTFSFSRTGGSSTNHVSDALTLSGPAARLIVTGENADLTLAGSGGGDALYMTGGANLTVDGGASASVSGGNMRTIQVDGGSSINITNGANFTLAGSDYIYGNGIQLDNGTLAVSDASLDISSGTGVFLTAGNVSLDNATVSITHKSSGTNYAGTGMDIAGGSLSITNGTNLEIDMGTSYTGTGLAAGDSGNILISGADTSVTIFNNGVSSSGIETYYGGHLGVSPSITITDGASVTVESDSSSHANGVTGGIGYILVDDGGSLTLNVSKGNGIYSGNIIAGDGGTLDVNVGTGDGIVAGYLTLQNGSDVTVDVEAGNGVLNWGGQINIEEGANLTVTTDVGYYTLRDLSKASRANIEGNLVANTGDVHISGIATGSGSIILNNGSAVSGNGSLASSLNIMSDDGWQRYKPGTVGTNATLTASNSTMTKLELWWEFGENTARDVVDGKLVRTNDDLLKVNNTLYLSEVTSVDDFIIHFGILDRVSDWEHAIASSSFKLIETTGDSIDFPSAFGGSTAVERANNFTLSWNLSHSNIGFALDQNTAIINNITATSQARSDAIAERATWTTIYYHPEWFDERGNLNATGQAAVSANAILGNLNGQDYYAAEIADSLAAKILSLANVPIGAIRDFGLNSDGGSLFLNLYYNEFYWNAFSGNGIWSDENEAHGFIGSEFAAAERAGTADTGFRHLIGIGTEHWEALPTFDAPGQTIHFVREQNAPTTVFIDNALLTLGSIEIGSENASANSTTQYTLASNDSYNGTTYNASIVLDNGKDHALIEQTANASLDTIAVNLLVAAKSSSDPQALDIHVLNPSATLTLNSIIFASGGNYSASAPSLNISGPGTLFIDNIVAAAPSAADSSKPSNGVTSLNFFSANTTIRGNISAADNLSGPDINIGNFSFRNVSLTVLGDTLARRLILYTDPNTTFAGDLRFSLGPSAPDGSDPYALYPRLGITKEGDGSLTVLGDLYDASIDGSPTPFSASISIGGGNASFAGNVTLNGSINATAAASTRSISFGKNISAASINIASSNNALLSIASGAQVSLGDGTHKDNAHDVDFDLSYYSASIPEAILRLSGASLSAAGANFTLSPSADFASIGVYYTGGGNAILIENAPVANLSGASITLDIPEANAVNSVLRVLASNAAHSLFDFSGGTLSLLGESTYGYAPLLLFGASNGSSLTANLSNAILDINLSSDGADFLVNNASGPSSSSTLLLENVLTHNASGLILTSDGAPILNSASGPSASASLTLSSSQNLTLTPPLLSSGGGGGGGGASGFDLLFGPSAGLLNTSKNGSNATASLDVPNLTIAAGSVAIRTSASGNRSAPATSAFTFITTGALSISAFGTAPDAAGPFGIVNTAESDNATAFTSIIADSLSIYGDRWNPADSSHPFGASAFFNAATGNSSNATTSVTTASLQINTFADAIINYAAFVPDIAYSPWDKDAPGPTASLTISAASLDIRSDANGIVNTANNTADSLTPAATASVTLHGVSGSITAGPNATAALLNLAAYSLDYGQTADDGQFFNLNSTASITLADSSLTLDTSSAVAARGILNLAAAGDFDLSDNYDAMDAYNNRALVTLSNTALSLIGNNGDPGSIGIHTLTSPGYSETITDADSSVPAGGTTGNFTLLPLSRATTSLTNGSNVQISGYELAFASSGVGASLNIASASSLTISDAGYTTGSFGDTIAAITYQGATLNIDGTLTDNSGNGIQIGDRYGEDTPADWNGYDPLYGEYNGSYYPSRGILSGSGTLNAFIKPQGADYTLVAPGSNPNGGSSANSTGTLRFTTDQDFAYYALTKTDLSPGTNGSGDSLFTYQWTYDTATGYSDVLDFGGNLFNLKDGTDYYTLTLDLSPTASGSTSQTTWLLISGTNLQVETTSVSTPEGMKDQVLWNFTSTGDLADFANALNLDPSALYLVKDTVAGVAGIYLRLIEPLPSGAYIWRQNVRDYWYTTGTAGVTNWEGSVSANPSAGDSVFFIRDNSGATGNEANAYIVGPTLTIGNLTIGALGNVTNASSYRIEGPYTDLHFNTNGNSDVAKLTHNPGAYPGDYLGVANLFADTPTLEINLNSPNALQIDLLVSGSPSSIQTNGNNIVIQGPGNLILSATQQLLIYDGMSMPTSSQDGAVHIDTGSLSIRSGATLFLGNPDGSGYGVQLLNAAGNLTIDDATLISADIDISSARAEALITNRPGENDFSPITTTIRNASLVDQGSSGALTILNNDATKQGASINLTLQDSSITTAPGDIAINSIAGQDASVTTAITRSSLSSVGVPVIYQTTNQNGLISTTITDSLLSVTGAYSAFINRASGTYANTTSSLSNSSLTVSNTGDSIQNIADTAFALAAFSLADGSVLTVSNTDNGIENYVSVSFSNAIFSAADSSISVSSSSIYSAAFKNIVSGGYGVANASFDNSVLTLSGPDAFQNQASNGFANLTLSNASNATFSASSNALLNTAFATATATASVQITDASLNASSSGAFAIVNTADLGAAYFRLDDASLTASGASAAFLNIADPATNAVFSANNSVVILSAPSVALQNTNADFLLDNSSFAASGSVILSGGQIQFANGSSASVSTSAAGASSFLQNSGSTTIGDYSGPAASLTLNASGSNASALDVKSGYFSILQTATVTNADSAHVNIDGSLILHGSLDLRSGVLSGNTAPSSYGITDASPASILTDGTLRLAPGRYEASTGDYKIGTLGFTNTGYTNPPILLFSPGTASFDNLLVNYQFGNLDGDASVGPGNGNDLLALSGYNVDLANASLSNFSFNFSASNLSGTLSDGAHFTLLSVADGGNGAALINYAAYLAAFNADASIQSTLQSLLSTSATFSLNASASALWLEVSLASAASFDGAYIWTTNTSASWSNASGSPQAYWEGSPNQNPSAGDNVFFIRNQSSTASASLAASVTLGNLTIGSENASAGSFLITSSTSESISFDTNGNGSSSLTHHANASPGDTIAAPIVFDANDLAIIAASANPLVLSGHLSTSTGKNLTVSGGGRVDFTENAPLNLASITVTGPGTNAVVTATTTALINDSSDVILVTDGAALNVRSSAGSSSIINAGNLTASGSGSLISASATPNTPGYAISNSGNLNAFDTAQIRLSTATSQIALQNTASGNVTVASGASLSASTSSVASAVNNLGNILLTGSGSLLSATTSTSSGHAVVNNSQSANLTVADGAELRAVSSAGGVGVLNSAGNILVTGSGSLLNASSTGSGNALLNSANLTVTDSAFLNATASSTGAALYNSANFTVSSASFNASSASSGSAFINSGSNARLILTDASANLSASATTALINTASASASITASSFNVTASKVAVLNESAASFSLADSTASLTASFFGFMNQFGSSANISNSTLVLTTSQDGFVNYGSSALLSNASNLTVTAPNIGIQNEDASFILSNASASVSDATIGILNSVNANLTLADNASLTLNPSATTTAENLRNDNASVTVASGASLTSVNSASNSTGINNISANFTVTGHGSSLDVTAAAPALAAIQNTDSANFILADNANASVSGSVSGAGSAAILNTNSANFTIASGASLNVTASAPANRVFNSANFTLTGTGSSLNLSASGSPVTGTGFYNTGNLLISDGASLTGTANASDDFLYNAAGANVTVADASISFTTLNTNQQQLIENDGSISATNASITLDGSAGSGDNAMVRNTGSFSLSNSTLDSTSSKGSSSFSNANGGVLTASDNSSLVLTNIGDSSGINNNGSTVLVSNSSLDVTNTLTSTGTGLTNTNGSFTLADNATVSLDIQAGTGIRNTGSFANFTVANASLSVTGGSNGISNINSANFNLTGSSVANLTVNGTANAILNSANFTLTDSASLNVTKAGSPLDAANGVYNTGNLILRDSSNLIITSVNPNAGRGFQNVGGTLAILDSSTLYTAGTGVPVFHNMGAIILDGTIHHTDSAPFLHDAGGSLSGCGTFNGSFSIVSPSAIIAPGHSAGTLTFNGSQSWSSGFTYNWELADFSADSGNDLIALTNGSLSLNLTNFSLNASYIGATLPADASDLAAFFTLISTPNTISLTGSSLLAWNNARSAALSASLRSALSLASGSFRLALANNDHDLVLAFSPLSLGGTYIWNANQTDSWSNTDGPSGSQLLWEASPSTAPRAGDEVFFIRDQTALPSSTAIATLADSVEIGHLTIGSENSTSTFLINPAASQSITFNANSAGAPSYLIHHAASAAGDTISANILLKNDLAISALSTNPLTLNGIVGDRSSSSFNITLTGTGDPSNRGAVTLNIASDRTPGPNPTDRSSALEFNNLTLDNAAHLTINHISGSMFGIMNYYLGGSNNDETSPAVITIQNGSLLSLVSTFSDNANTNKLLYLRSNSTLSVSGENSAVEFTSSNADVRFVDPNVYATFSDGAEFRGTVSSASASAYAVTVDLAANLTVSNASADLNASGAASVLSINRAASIVFSNNAQVSLSAASGHAIVNDNTDARQFSGISSLTISNSTVNAASTSGYALLNVGNSNNTIVSKISTSLVSISDGANVTLSSASSNALLNTSNNTSGFAVINISGNDTSVTAADSGWASSESVASIYNTGANSSISVSDNASLTAADALVNTNAAQITVASGASLNVTNGTFYNLNANITLDGGSLSKTGTHYFTNNGSNAFLSLLNGSFTINPSGSGSADSFNENGARISVSGGNLIVENNFLNKSGANTSLSAGSITVNGSYYSNNGSGTSSSVSGGNLSVKEWLANENAALFSISGGNTSVSGGLSNMDASSVFTLSGGNLSVSGIKENASVLNNRDSALFIVSGPSANLSVSAASSNNALLNSSSFIANASASVSTFSADGNGIHNTASFSASAASLSLAVSGSGAAFVNFGPSASFTLNDSASLVITSSNNGIRNIDGASLSFDHASASITANLTAGNAIINNSTTAAAPTSAIFTASSLSLIATHNGIWNHADGTNGMGNPVYGNILLDASSANITAAFDNAAAIRNDAVAGAIANLNIINGSNITLTAGSNQFNWGLATLATHDYSKANTFISGPSTSLNVTSGDAAFLVTSEADNTYNPNFANLTVTNGASVIANATGTAASGIAATSGNAQSLLTFSDGAQVSATGTSNGILLQGFQITKYGSSSLTIDGPSTVVSATGTDNGIFLSAGNKTASGGATSFTLNDGCVTATGNNALFNNVTGAGSSILTLNGGSLSLIGGSTGLFNLAQDFTGSGSVVASINGASVTASGETAVFNQALYQHTSAALTVSAGSLIASSDSVALHNNAQYDSASAVVTFNGSSASSLSANSTTATALLNDAASTGTATVNLAESASLAIVTSNGAAAINLANGNINLDDGANLSVSGGGIIQVASGAFIHDAGLSAGNGLSTGTSIIAGSGTVDASVLTQASLNNLKLAPGDYNTSTQSHTIGTLTLNGDLDLSLSGSNGDLTLFWQAGNLSTNGTHIPDGSGSNFGNDLLFINGSFTMPATAAFHLDLSVLASATGSVNPDIQSPGTSSNTRFYLLQTSDYLILGNFDPDAWTAANRSTLRNFASQLGLTGYSFRLYEDASAKALYIELFKNEQFYWRTGSGSGSWTAIDPSNPSYSYWTNSTDQISLLPETVIANYEFNIANITVGGAANSGETVYFVHNQTAATTVTVDGQHTVGHITIGSQYANATTSYNITGTGGNSITLHAVTGESVIAHHANAILGDVLDVPLVLANDLTIDVRSASANYLYLTNATLFSSSSSDRHDVYKAGSGNLVLQSSSSPYRYLNPVGNFIVTNGQLYLNGNYYNPGGNALIATGSGAKITESAYLRLTDAGAKLIVEDNALLEALTYGHIQLNAANTDLIVRTGGKISNYGIANNAFLISPGANATFTDGGLYEGINGAWFENKGNTSVLDASLFKLTGGLFQNNGTAVIDNATFENTGGGIVRNFFGSLYTITLQNNATYYGHAASAFHNAGELLIIASSFTHNAFQGSSASNDVFENTGDIRLQSGASFAYFGNNTTLPIGADARANAVFTSTGQIDISGGSSFSIASATARIDTSIGNSDTVLVENASFTVADGAVLTLNASYGNGIHADGSSASLSITGHIPGSSVHNTTFTANITGSAVTGITLDNGASLDISDRAVFLLENTASSIAGIYASDGNITVSSGASLSVNTTASEDGIYLGDEASTLSVSSASLLVTNNDTGNGIRTNSASVRLTNASASVENLAAGNGIAFEGTDGSFLIENSTFTLNNTAAGNGIAFGSSGYAFTVSNSTFTLNAADGTGIAFIPGADAVISLENSLLIATAGNGSAIVSPVGLNASNNTRILNDNLIDLSGQSLNATGGCVTLAGSGAYNAELTGAGSFRVSPGGTYNATSGAIEHSVATLTLNGAQDFTSSNLPNGLVLDWQMGSTTLNDQISNDLLKITNGALTLDASASYTVNLLNGGLTTCAGLSDQMEWDLITASAGISGFTDANWTLNGASAFLAQFGLSSAIYDFSIQLSSTDPSNTIVLKLNVLATDFYWKAQTSGLWHEAPPTDGTNWEDGIVPDGPAITAYFIRNQTDGATGVVDLHDVSGHDHWAVGNLVIGSENNTASAGHHLLFNGTLAFNSGSSSVNSTLSHLASAQAGDVIAAELSLVTDLVIQTDSPTDNYLLLSGNLSASTNANVTKSGSGDVRLTASASSLGDGNLSVNTGGLFLADRDASLSAANTTVASGALLGGNGTLDSNLVMAAQTSAISINATRPGARYNDSLTVSGDAFAQNGFTFYLDADFSNVHVGSYGATDNFGDTATGGSKDNTAYLHNQLYNSSFAANLFLDGDLFSDPSAVYSLNINNIGGSVSITDWTLYKQNCSSVGFLLFTVTGAMDQGTWNLLGLNASDGWSLSWMDNAEGHHQLWLFYANPTRIPEPATTALLLGLLALAALFLFHHKGHKGFPKGHKAPNL